MPTKIYNKLVRDKIPEIIKSSGKDCTTEILPDDKYIEMLDNKLLEECDEYLESKSLEELADILEVLRAITTARGYTLDELEKMRKEKAEKRGGFNDKILLKEVSDGDEKHFIILMKEYLEENELLHTSSINESVKKRENNEMFSFDDHLRGLIYSLLSNQRPWVGILNNLEHIEKIFFGFNKEKIIKADISELEFQIRNIKCGNRKIHSQMQNLKYNIKILEKIENDYGSLDNFVTHTNPYEVVKLLSDYKSKYKLKEIGEPLAWEYIRNLGVDGAKPDLHLRRIFGADRLGFSSKSEVSIGEVLKIISSIKHETKLYEYEIDAIVWSYCSKDFGNICTASPNCKKCIISDRCNIGRVKI